GGSGVMQLAIAASVRAKIRLAATILDDTRVDMAILYHHGVIEHGHVGHAAVAVACIEIRPEDRILFGCRRGRAHVANHIGVAFGDPAHVARGSKISGYHTDRHASPATLTSGPVGY